MSPTDPDGRFRRQALLAILALFALQLAGAWLGSFRADDWLNLEQGARALTPEGWRPTWTRLNAFTLYRPLVDLWHGALLRTFGLRSAPMMALLVALLGLHTFLLARLARARGASRETALLIAFAAWAQVNTYTWTTLWVSNATGSLMATFALLALLLHHRGVRLAGQGRLEAAGFATAGAAGAFLLGALCKEEIVLLVPALAVMELLRSERLRPSERHTSAGSIGLMAVACAGYLYFRTQILPTPQIGGSRYHLALGTHILKNLAFFTAHLGALPAVALLVSLVLARGRRMGAAALQLPRESLVGAAWAVIATLLYLPIQGQPAYGYLYLPALAVAYAVGSALGALWPSGERGSPAPAILAAHALLALLLTSAGLVAIGWPRYRGLVAEIGQTLQRELPDPAPGAEMVFLDAGAPSETPRGRTLFNMVLDDATGSYLRLLYRREDVFGRVVHGAAAQAGEKLPPPAAAVFVARLGRIVRIARAGPAPGAAHDSSPAPR